MMQDNPFSSRVVGLLAFSWISITALLIAYRAPYMDEGYYGMGTYNYLYHDQMDARQIEPSAYIFPANDKPNTRVDKRAYFQMPLEMILQSGWEKLFGWGLKQQRSFSAVFGLAALFFWFGFIRRLSGPGIAALATVLIAFDWNFISAAASGRMDMMSHACGLAALYFHERYYAERPALARALSSAGLCAAALSHPNGFFVWGAVYAARSLSQWRRWHVREWAAFAGPIAISAAGLAWWISYDPVAFKDQIALNGGFRFASMSLNDLPRYAKMYGIEVARAASERMKVYALIVFGMGYLALLKWGVKKLSGFTTCLGLTGVAAFALAVFDATKWVYYGLHTVPWLAVLAAFGFYAAWSRGWKKTVLGVLAVYTIIPLLSTIIIARRDPLATYYQPAVEALRRVGHEGTIAFAPPEFIFGDPENMLYDVRYGYISHRTVSAFASDQRVLKETMNWAKTHNPGLYAHLDRLVHKDCRPSYTNERYAVYRCEAASPPGAL